MQLLSIKECLPPTNGVVFLAFNENFHTYQIAFFNNTHKHFKTVNGDFYGNELQPKFTHWCKLPVFINAPFDIINKYNAWKTEHPNEDYQLDEINEFYSGLDRSEKVEIMEYILYSIKQ